MDTPTLNELTMTVLMTPDMANFSGKVHGGHVLKLLDQVAYACASRYAKCYVVTMALDEVIFRQPIQVQELVTFHAAVNFTGRTSMEIGIQVIAENVRTQIARHAVTCYFTMVAVDEQGQGIEVPPFEPVTAAEKSRHALALQRKKLRQDYQRARDAAMSGAMSGAMPGATSGAMPAA